MRKSKHTALFNASRGIQIYAGLFRCPQLLVTNASSTLIAFSDREYKSPPPLPPCFSNDVAVIQTQVSATLIFMVLPRSDGYATGSAGRES